MRKEKEIREWIEKLHYEIEELKSQITKDSPIGQDRVVNDRISEKQIEILHYQRCLGEV